jgi:nitroreductase
MNFLEAMNFRHACKVFDEGKKIPEGLVKNIAEVGRLSPSSFGMEPWEFLIIQSQDIKEALRPSCWNQVQITSCSELLVIVTKNKLVEPGNRYVEEMFKRKKMPQEMFDTYMGVYADFLGAKAEGKPDFYKDWSAKQAYIAAGNMMTYAATEGIDSCPIEGFDQKAVEKTLEIDGEEKSVALLIAFGYRLNEQPQKVRLPADKIYRYL